MNFKFLEPTHGLIRAQSKRASIDSDDPKIIKKKIYFKVKSHGISFLSSGHQPHPKSEPGLTLLYFLSPGTVSNIPVLLY